MTLKSDIDQLAVDAVLMHQVVHGDATTTVTTAGGPVRSVAKLIADKDAEINVSAGGILAQSVAQVGFATQQAVAAGNSLSQVNIAVAQAISAAGTAQTYSTALAAIASQTAILPSATVTGFNGVVLTSLIVDMRNESDSGAWCKAIQGTRYYTEPTTATGKNLGKLASLAAAWAVSGAAVGDHYYDQTAKLFYSIGGTAGAPTRAEIWNTSKSDVPAVVGITAEAGRVVLWDFTDSTQPMWKVFLVGQGRAAYRTPTSLAFKNGELLVGCNNGSTGGLGVIDFIRDYQYLRLSTSSAYNGASLADRNNFLADPITGVTVPIVSNLVNTVSVSILPAAPIDASRGLPVSTKAIGTAAGASWIKDDGTVVNATGAVALISASIDSAGRTLFASASKVYVYNAVPQVNTTLAAADYIFDTAGTSSPHIDGTIVSAKWAGSRILIATSTGFFSIVYNQSAPGSSLFSKVRNTSNSGCQVGDIRGAWLADTVVETISNPGASADCSVKNNPLTVFGSLTKAPVAAGSQLVGWSGFAAGANYLEQTYSANLDFGTADFCIPVWVNPSTAAQNSTIYTRSPAALAGNSFALNLVGGVLQLGRSIAGAAFANTTFGYTPPINTWTLVNLARVAGVISLRINGVQQATTIADTNNYTNATAVFTVGVDNAHANPFLGALSLLRVSATPASTDQGVYRYETERKFFLPGAQCCIAGSSAVVTLVPDFDELTGITSIVTSWGVTEFVGLQAINSYATTVGTPSAISTKSGYKLLSGATGTSLYKPSRLLAEELTRTAAQRKAFGARLLKKTFTATAGQTDFNLGIGEEPVSVYQMGTLKDEGAGAGLYTIADSGFRKTIKLGTGATVGDRVTIFYTQNL